MAFNKGELFESLDEFEAKLKAFQASSNVLFSRKSSKKELCLSESCFLNMVWKLGDLCLLCVQENLRSYPHLGCSLPTVFKELLIERLASHDQFFSEHLNHIKSNLYSSALRHIDFQSCDQITDGVLKLLSSSGCKLESLKMKRLKNVTDVGVQAIVQGQSDLLVLHLKELPSVTGKTLTSIKAPQMWSFAFTHSIKNLSKSFLNNTVLTSFLTDNPSIKILKMTSAIDFLPTIAQCLNTALEELNTNVQLVTDEGIEKLAQYCPNLKKLDLNGAKNVGKDSLIKTCTQLRDLDLGYCSRLCNPPECQVMWILPQSLVTLSLVGLMLKDEEIFVESITRLPNIANLKLCGVAALNDSSLAKIAERIGPQLITLNLNGFGGSEVSDEGLKAIATHCVYLEALYVSLLRQVTGSTLTPLFTNPTRAARLKALGINSREMKESVVEMAVTNCHNLERIDLTGLSFVTDSLIMTLADNAPKLNSLSVNGCKQLTDAAICYLCGRCPLKYLILSGIHGLTDKSIFCLASSCPQLEEIYLNACARVSPVVVQYLKDRCLGRLFVKHTIPNASPNQMMGKNLDTGEFCRVDLL